MRRYPEFNQDLQSAFLTLRAFQSAQNTKLNPARFDEIKKEYFSAYRIGQVL